MINKKGEIVKIVKIFMIQHFPHVFLQYLRYFSFRQYLSCLAEQVAAGHTSTQFEAAGVIPGPSPQLLQHPFLYFSKTQYFLAYSGHSAHLSLQLHNPQVLWHFSGYLEQSSSRLLSHSCGPHLSIQ